MAWPVQWYNIFCLLGEKLQNNCYTNRHVARMHYEHISRYHPTHFLKLYMLTVDFILYY